MKQTDLVVDHGFPAIRLVPRPTKVRKYTQTTLDRYRKTKKRKS